MVDYCPLDYPCLQHVRANTGREVMGGGYNDSFLGLFWVF